MEMEYGRVAVLGAGITGLTAAWQLRQAGLTPVVFEAGARVGGAIGGWRIDGWLHELGPNSLLEGSPDVAALIDSIGLGARRLYAAPAAKRRYIVRGGRLVAMPTSPLGFVSTRLFSTRAKLALLGEPWRTRAPGDAEESVADFVLRRLGREFLDYAVNPFVGGVYAGDPARLSVRHAFPKLHAIEQAHGSLIRGALARRNTSGGPRGAMFSFPGGLSELPEAIAAQLGEAVRLQHRVVALRRQDDTWEIEYTHAGVRDAASFAAVVCALPANALAELPIEGATAAHQLQVLRQVESPTVVSVFLGYRRGDIAHLLDGFGLLVPEVERRSILGTLFSSTLFPARAPDGCVGLTSFVGGVRDAALTTLDDADLARVVHAELRELLGARAAPVVTYIQRCPRAIPQYTLGYQRFEAAIAAAEQSAPGLFIGGTARDGISLGNCIGAGGRLARATANHVGRFANYSV